jgi:SAM-dependent methyltransferase
VDNYHYCADFAGRAIADRAGEAKVLDFGCGAGQIVKILRDSGIAAFGCDALYGGGAYPIPAELAGVVFAMQGNQIPFPALMFDVVINNQVMEHVDDLDAALSEICRVLKPGGVVLSLFPDAGIWREKHCGIPFLHWFPKGSALRIYYAALLRSVGFGQAKDDRSYLKWSRDFCAWLDQWTVYRSYREIAQTYGKYFSPPQHLEEHWLESRLGPLVRYFPVALQRIFVNKMAGMVFTVRKAAA